MRVAGLLLACLGFSSVSGQALTADANNIFHITGGNQAPVTGPPAIAAGWIFANGTASVINPTLNMTIGTTYYFSIEFDSATQNHPFGLNNQAGPGAGTQNVAENGLVNNATSCGGTVSPGYTASSTKNCILQFTPTATSTQPLYYHCGFHSSMWGPIQLNAAAANGTTAAPTTPVPSTNTTTAPPTTPTTTAPPTTAAPANTLNPDATNTFHVTGGNPGSGWTFLGATAPNPTLNIAYGKTYFLSIEFDTTTAGGNHPFGLSASGTGTTAVADFGLVNVNTTCGGSATAGFTASATKNCVLQFSPPATTPQPLYYHCTVHQGMVGQIVVSGLPKGGSGFALVPGFAALFAVVAGILAAAQ